MGFLLHLRPMVRASSVQEGIPQALMPARPVNWDRWTWWLVMVGVVCRAAQYLWDRSFWVDEASLVLNIRGKSAAQLLGGLSYHQAAPPLFLLAERGLYRALGGSEFSLRLLPLMAGCASVVVFAVLARRLLRPWAAVVAIALFAMSDRLIWHSAEVKQYGTDVLAGLILTLLAVGPREAPVDPLRRLARTSVAAALLVWFSFAAALVYAGLSLALLPAMVRRRRARGCLAWLACTAPVALCAFGVLLASHAQHDQALMDYWREDFVDWHRPLSIPIWLVRHLYALCNYPTDPAGFLIFPMAIVGAAAMARAGKIQRVACLVVPIAVNLFAAAAHRYPFDGGRLTVYLTPAVLLLAAGGADLVYQSCRKRAGVWSAAPAAILVAISAGFALFHLAVPRWRDHIRPAVQFVRAHARADDGIYALQRREFDCYWPAADAARVSANLVPADEIPFTRFWVVWSFPNRKALSRIEAVRSWAGRFATERARFITDGGCAFLYEVSGPRNHDQPPSVLTHHKTMTPADQDAPASSGE